MQLSVRVAVSNTTSCKGHRRGTTSFRTDLLSENPAVAMAMPSNMLMTMMMMMMTMTMTMMMMMMMMVTTMLTVRVVMMNIAEMTTSGNVMRSLHCNTDGDEDEDVVDVGHNAVLMITS